MFHMVYRCNAVAPTIRSSAERAVTWSGSMSTVLDDVTSETVDAEHMRRRVEKVADYERNARQD